MVEAAKRWFKTKTTKRSYERQELLDELNITNTILHKIMIPSLNSYVEIGNDTTLNVKEHKKMMVLFASMGIKSGEMINDGVQELLTFAEEIVSVVETLKSLTYALPSVMTDKTMTAKELAVVSLVTNLSALTMFLSDVMVAMIYYFGGDQDNVVTNRIFKASPAYKRISGKYKGKLVKIVSLVNGLSNNRPYDAAMFRISATLKDKGFSMPVNNLVASPIYYLRRLIVDLEINYYEHLDTRQKLIVLKIKELELGTHSPDIEKQIKWYENKLASLQYSIKKLESRFKDE